VSRSLTIIVRSSALITGPRGITSPKASRNMWPMGTPANHENQTLRNRISCNALQPSTLDSLDRSAELGQHVRLIRYRLARVSFNEILRRPARRQQVVSLL
jgi:hypothetical protein